MILNLALAISLCFPGARESQRSLKSERGAISTREIGIEEAKSALARGDSIFVDARAADAYAYAHIPGAYSLPPGDDPRSSLLQTLRDAKMVIVYCDGKECDASHQVADRLTRLGINRLRVFAGGMSKWRDGALPVQASKP